MVTRENLLEIFGSNSRMSEALSRKRPLSKNQLVKICVRFQLPGETIIKYLVNTDPSLAGERILRIGRSCSAHLTEDVRTREHGEMLYDSQGIPQ